jgi:hypothetical protein
MISILLVLFSPLKYNMPARKFTVNNTILLTVMVLYTI